MDPNIQGESSISPERVREILIQHALKAEVVDRNQLRENLALLVLGSDIAAGGMHADDPAVQAFHSMVDRMEEVEIISTRLLHGRNTGVFVNGITRQSCLGLSLMSKLLSPCRR